MQLGKSLGLFGQHFAFKTTGAASAARSLVRALESPDETARTLAGMFLVKNGAKSLPYLREALSQRQSVPMVLQIMADIGEPSVEPDLVQFTDDPDPEVARAARAALETLRFLHHS